MKINRHTCQNRAHAVKESRLEELRVSSVPSSFAAPPNQTYSNHQNNLFAGIENVEAMPIDIASFGETYCHGITINR